MITRFCSIDVCLTNNNADYNVWERRYAVNGKKYTLNLIDTPGHIDFNFEVSRSLAAIQGVILLVDANEGIQAQTLGKWPLLIDCLFSNNHSTSSGNFFLAFERNLVIIPTLNKIDLKTAIPDLVTEQMKSVFDMKDSEFIRVSAKTGIGINELLLAVVERIPPPIVKPSDPLKSLIFDSLHIPGKGYRCSVFVSDGELNKNVNVQLYNRL